MSLLPIKNGWYRVPGDGQTEHEKTQVDPEQRFAPVWNMRYFFWAYVENGIPIALTTKTEAKFDPNQDTVLTANGRAYVPTYEDFWGESLRHLMFAKYGLLGQACKWNGKPTHFAVDADLRAKPPTDLSTVSAEQVLIVNAVETGRRRLKNSLRAWPYCPQGSGVELAPILDRYMGAISLAYHCDCGT